MSKYEKPEIKIEVILVEDICAQSGGLGGRLPGEKIIDGMNWM